MPPEQACYDVLHYDLALRVDPSTRSIDGTLGLRARVLARSDSLLLDLDTRLSVERITRRGALVEFAREGGRIRVKGIPELGEVGAELELAVAYRGEPRVAPSPPWDGGFTWARTESGAPWIATSCQGEGADLWWPCKDQPSDEPETMDLHFSVPEPLVVASNGRASGVAPAGPGWRTYSWHVSTPINNYSVALCAAPYELLTGEYTSTGGERMQIAFYVLPEDRERGAKLFPEIARDLAFFESVCGPYPFRGDKYAVVQTPHLGMEQQTITGYGHSFGGNPWGADQGFDFLLHHEMAHEWWALLVSARNWNDFWIHEGLGSYMQALYAERVRGPEGYRQVLREQRRSIANRGAVAPREPRSSQEMYFTSRWKDSPAGDIYFKGSWIVHTLRFLLGDEVFFRVLRRWAYPDPELERTTDGRACRFATTDELLAIAERESGRELDWFFELYLRQPALPRLAAEVQGDELHLSWQTPNGLAFPMPVEVRVGGETRRVELEQGRASLRLGAARDYELDPDERILRELVPRPARK